MSRRIREPRAMSPRRRRLQSGTAEAAIMILVLGLILAGGVVGWVVGHYVGSRLAAKYSAEGQPVVYKGVIYITTGEDDTYAVSVATGKILWRYTSGISQEISTICCGWDNRGVAIGDGRVYLGQLDGTVVALDQQTGKVLWKKRLVRWQLGQTITAAPIYVDGRIYIGVVGAEYGT